MKAFPMHFKLSKKNNMKNLKNFLFHSIVLLAVCLTTSSAQSFAHINNELASLQRFIEGFRPRFAVSSAFQPLPQNPPSQPCNCVEVQQQHNNNNNHNVVQATPKTDTTSNMPTTNLNSNVPTRNVGTTNQALSTNLLNRLKTIKPTSNIMFSPLSLEILLIFVTLGARGLTAKELQNALHLPANEQQMTTQAMSKLNRAYNSEDANVVMANKMYYANNLLPEQNLSRSANNLQTELEPTNFAAAGQTANKINNWVAQRTNNHIQNLVSPESLSDQTESMLVNAIYFKGKWNAPFSTSDTKRQTFYNMGNQPVLVNMMYIEEFFAYGEFPELGAKVLELPYKDSDMSMMIILPDREDGLDDVERRLASHDLDKLSEGLQLKTVNVRMPKFQFESELDMVQPLMQAGIKELFSNTADLSGLFHNNSPKVSKVQSKAFLNVNEAGSEAAAASFYRLVPLSLPPKILLFVVDHPFIFAIRAPNVVYFMGHITSMQSL